MGPPSLVLITVDTLRRDHLDLYGYGRRTMPHVSALAENGVAFDDAITPIPKTAPALASMMTGLYPNSHKVQVNYGSRLDASFTTLAEVLASRGYRTAAIVSNNVLVRSQNAPSGLDQGFATYDDQLLTPESAKRPEIRERRAEPTTDAAIAWLRESGSRGSDPIFLWVHYIDPHGLYDPPEPYRSKWKSAGPSPIPEPKDPLDPWVRLWYVCPYNLLERPDLNLHLDRYDGEISYADAQIGRLLDALDDSGVTDNALVVFTADHGESFGEHGVFFEHGFDLYEESIRIPLVLAMPGHLPEGTRVPGLVQLADVFPTALDVLGVPLPAGLDGQTLSKAARGEAAIPADREVVLESNEGARTLGKYPRGSRTSRSKLVLTFQPSDDGKTYHVTDRELYDLEADPREHDNRYDPNSPRSQRLAERVLSFLFPSKKAESLQSIGYVQGFDLDTAQRRLSDWLAKGGPGGAAALKAIGHGVIPPLASQLARETDPRLIAALGEGFRGLVGTEHLAYVTEGLEKTAAAGLEANEAEFRSALRVMPPHSNAQVVAALGALIDARDPSNPRVRRAAVQALSHPPLHAEAIPLLFRTLEDEAPEVRIAAVKALQVFPIQAERDKIAAKLVDRLSAENEASDRRDDVILALRDALFLYSGRSAAAFGELAPPGSPPENGGGVVAPSREQVSRALEGIRPLFK